MMTLVGALYGGVAGKTYGLIPNVQSSKNWWDELYTRRIPITINPYQIPEPQNDFQLLINSRFPDLVDHKLDEIRFVGTERRPYDYEIQKFDSTTGKLIAWVKKPTIQHGNVTYIHFDNPDAKDSQNPHTVWDDDYNAVFHFEDNVDDSTINAQHLRNSGSLSVDGKIGNAKAYSKDSVDYQIVDPFTVFAGNEYQVEFWAKFSNKDAGTLFSYFTSKNKRAFVLALVNFEFYLFINDASFIFEHDFNNNFRHIVIQRRVDDGALVVYIDNKVIINKIGFRAGEQTEDNGSLVIGQDQKERGSDFSSSVSYDGIIDEIRFSNKIKSKSWIESTYNNQNNPDSFYHIGIVESI